MSKSKTYKRLKSHLLVASGLGLPTGGIALSYDKWIPAFQQDTIFGVLYITLLIVTLGRAFAYYHATDDELEMMHEIFDNDEVPFIQHFSLLFAITLGLAFGASVAFSHMIIVYASITFVLQIADYLGVTTVTKKVYGMILGAIKERGGIDQKLEILYDYYIVNPQIARTAVLVILYGIALQIAIVHQIYDNNIMLEYIAYAICIGAGVVNEVLIWRWRVKRDKRLHSCEENASA